MKITEIIRESKSLVKTGIKPITKDHEYAMPNAHRVAGTADRIYDLNRLMMLVAAADGRTMPVVPEESWAGRNNMAFPFTAQEAQMLKHCYKVLGQEWDDVLFPNTHDRSEEFKKDINIKSPVAKIKKNKYGV